MVFTGGREPLIINDTKQHPQTCNMEVIYAGNVGSYLGVPIFLENGTLFGTICATDPDPFNFTSDHVEKLMLFADMIVSLITKVEHDSSYIQRQLNYFEQLSAGMSDKIGNSIQVIRGFMQLTLDSNSFYSKLLIDEVDKIREVLRNFELTTKPPAPIKRDFLFNQLIEDINQEFKDECYLKNIELITIVEVIGTIQADYGQIKQVIKNLLRNSIDAIKTNGIIELRVTYLHPHLLSFTVSDNGHGIPYSILEKIESPFFTTKENSIGLGLSITRRIIDAHRGSMLIDTSQNGTTVLVEIPVNEDFSLLDPPYY